MKRQTSSQSNIDPAGHPIQSITDLLSHTRNTLLETQEQIQRATDVLAQGQKLLDATPASASIAESRLAQVNQAPGAFSTALLPPPEHIPADD